jgi:hypothetical protein
MRDRSSGSASTRTAEERVEQLSRKVDDQAAELDRLRALVEAPLGPDGHGGGAQVPEATRSGGRRRRRVGRANRDDSPESSGLVSRRRLFGLLGGAAAAGAGLAVAGSALSPDRADAVFPPMLLETTNDAGAATTSLTASGFAQTLELLNTGSGFGLYIDNSGSSNWPLVVKSKAGVSPLVLTGGAASAGPPTSGLHVQGELYLDQNAVLFYCTAVGTPGTWVNLSTGNNLVTLSTPARVYDSRIGQQPSTSPKSPITNGGVVNIDVTGAKAGGGNSGVPSGATAVLGNVTMINGPNTTFLTVFAAGTTAPSTSNINALGGQVIANNFTSQVGVSPFGNEISIQCGFGPTDFIIDIFGYYP